jgi:ubiquinone/menaquinone biosynthesis C-methylase UbiE
MNHVEHDAAKQKAEQTYNAAADFFDAPALAFWDRTGRQTIGRLGLSPGAHVLDIGCGTGASALPAAEAVGAGGRVVGLDLSGDLLALARDKAKRRGLSHVEFRKADMTASGYADGEFDAVVSVFSIFFVPDMESLVSELWRMVKPGGRLAVTTWGPDIFEPALSRWNMVVKGEREELYSAFNPWDRITTREAVEKLLMDGGIPRRNIEVEPEQASQALSTAEDWWTIVLGSGLRWAVEQLGPEAAERVRSDNIDWIKRNDVDSIAINAIYATATKIE